MTTQKDSRIEEIRRLGHVIWEEGGVITVEGNFINQYDEKTGTFHRECHIQVIDGNIIEVGEEKMTMEKKKGLRLIVRRSSETSANWTEYRW
jgi:hypothetical protein